MVNPDRIAQNFDIFNFELSKEDIEAIKTLNRNGRCNEPDIVSDDKLGSADNPFRHADDPVFCKMILWLRLAKSMRRRIGWITQRHNLRLFTEIPEMFVR